MESFLQIWWTKTEMVIFHRDLFEHIPKRIAWDRHRFASKQTKSKQTRSCHFIGLTQCFILLFPFSWNVLFWVAWRILLIIATGITNMWKKKWSLLWISLLSIVVLNDWYLVVVYEWFLGIITDCMQFVDRILLEWFVFIDSRSIEWI